MKKTLKALAKIIHWGVVLTILLFGAMLIFSTLEVPQIPKLFTVQSGSMEPAIKVGSVILIKPQLDYAKGDIITFSQKEELEAGQVISTVTHRIVDAHKESAEAESGEIEAEYFVTKGDANKNADAEKVLKEQVLGKVFLIIPYIGYAVGFARTQTGFTLLIVIPAVIIIYNEFLNIKKEMGEMIRRKREGREEVK